MRFLLSIKTSVSLGLFCGIFFPMLFAGLFTINSSKTKLYSDYEKYRKDTVTNISKAMADPIYYFSPGNGSLLLEVIKQDPRIVRINVYDALSDTDFITLDIPERREGSIFVNREKIFKNYENLGWVEIEFSDAVLQSEIEEKQEVLIAVFGVVTVVLFAVMFPLMYLKIFSPLNRLLEQAVAFKEKRLNHAFFWKGRDEIGILGESFEIARVSILELVNELKHKNEELQRLYITDRLTGIFNRYKLDAALDNELKRKKRFSHPFSVIILDIDHFKSVNDTYGHQVGDSVLIDIAKILKKSIREVDILGRWGGEEFLIICPETSKEGALQLAEKIRSTVATFHFQEVGKKTASFGVAEHRENENLKELISRADTALYQAKESGRNKVVIN